MSRRKFYVRDQLGELPGVEDDYLNELRNFLILFQNKLNVNTSVSFDGFR